MKVPKWCCKPGATRGATRGATMRASALLFLLQCARLRALAGPSSVGARLRTLRAAAPRTPHSGYHGQGEVDFFEGWYSRLTLPDEETSLALIYAIFDPGARTARSGVEAQVLVARADGIRTTRAATADCSRFAAAPHDLSVRNAFQSGERFSMTSTKHEGSIGDVSWAFAVVPAVGWGGRFDDPRARQYSTAGWLSSLGPLVSPHYQVLQSLGYATGRLRVGDREVAFSDAPFYAEKNWGRAFPRRWWWIQCNAFDDCEREVALTATGATRSLVSVGPSPPEDDVALIGIHVDGVFYPFPDVDWDVETWGAWRVKGSYDGLTVEIRATCDDGGAAVRVPTPEGMADGARESYRGTLTLAVRRGAEVILDASSSLACVEVGGDYGGAAWTGTSRMAEPLRSVAYDVGLERAVSSRLAAAQERGWLEIPGL